MSRQDPGAANGAVTGAVAAEPARRRCGHTVAIHALRNGRRTGCSASTCNCKTFTEEA